MAEIDKFFFSGGLSFSRICAGDEVASLRMLEKLLEVKLVSRENWVELSGNEKNILRAKSFLKELSELFLAQKHQIERKDFEFLYRLYRNEHESDLPNLWKESIQVSPKKRPIMPRSRSQLSYVQMIKKNDLTFGIGAAGTGKTYLAMAMAVSAYLSGNVNRIVLTRPARESGENLGFLPGSLEEKILPYLRPLYDALYDMMSIEDAKNLIAKDVIEVAPLAFMRGRTLNNAFIILDEAQNCTSEQMLMFLTRMGFGSKCVVTGDPSQSDLTSKERSGLSHAMNSLNEIDGIGFCYFKTTDVVRHLLLEKIINAYTADTAQKKQDNF